VTGNVLPHSSSSSSTYMHCRGLGSAVSVEVLSCEKKMEFCLFAPGAYPTYGSVPFPTIIVADFNELLKIPGILSPISC
jgi:hypothetical protein